MPDNQLQDLGEAFCITSNNCTNGWQTFCSFIWNDKKQYLFQDFCFNEVNNTRIQWEQKDNSRGTCNPNKNHEMLKKASKQKQFERPIG